MGVHSCAASPAPSFSLLLAGLVPVGFSPISLDVPGFLTVLDVPRVPRENTHMGDMGEMGENIPEGGEGVPPPRGPADRDKH